MALQRRQAKNRAMLIRPLPPRQSRQAWLWLAPYAAIGLFAVAMLIVTGLLQWREQDTALSALEGDMHWAERTIEARLHAHQDFLGELGREQEFRQLTYESFQVRASRYVRENPEIGAIIWVSIEGKVEWVAPNESTATFVGEQLTAIRLTALEEALRTRRVLFSSDYAGADERVANDLIVPVQQGSSDLGAFIALQSLEGLLRVTLPATFTARYSLSVVDAENREVYSNSSVRPTDRRISGTISLDLPSNRLGLNVVAYRGGGAWLPLLPAALIVVLTLITSATLLQLRRRCAWWGLKIAVDCQVITHGVAFNQPTHTVNQRRWCAGAAVRPCETHLAGTNCGQVGLHGQAAQQIDRISVGQVQKSALLRQCDGFQADAVVAGAERTLLGTQQHFHMRRVGVTHLKMEAQRIGFLQQHIGLAATVKSDPVLARSLCTGAGRDVEMQQDHLAPLRGQHHVLLQAGKRLVQQGIDLAVELVFLIEGVDGR